MRLLSIPLIVTALCLGAPAQQELTVDQILEKHFEAQGGADKLKAIKTVKITGKAIMGGGAMEAPLTLSMKKPLSVRMEMSLQGRSIVSGFDGKTAWMINPLTGSSDPQPLSEDDAREMADQADLDGPLMDYKSKGNSVELIGKEDVEGTAAYKLKVTRKSGRTEYQFMDAQSFLLVKSIGKRKQMGQEFEVESFPGNYKQVSGVLMPHSVESKVGGKTIMQMVFDSIVVNGPIEDAIFRMPPPPPKKEPEKK